jgi:hypothetical protein
MRRNVGDRWMSVFFALSIYLATCDGIIIKAQDGPFLSVARGVTRSYDFAAGLGRTRRLGILVEARRSPGIVSKCIAIGRLCISFDPTRFGSE